MEGVSYATHRWVMHGRGMPWHRSHHPPRTGRLREATTCSRCLRGLARSRCSRSRAEPGSPAGWGQRPASPPTASATRRARACSSTAGCRLRLPPPALPAHGCEDSHRIHHLDGGEPYGMLLPMVRPSSGVRGPPRRWTAAARQQREPAACPVVALHRDARRVRRTAYSIIAGGIATGGFNSANSGSRRAPTSAPSSARRVSAANLGAPPSSSTAGAASSCRRRTARPPPAGGPSNAGCRGGR